MQARFSNLTNAALASSVPFLPETSLYQVIFRNGIWPLGIITWLFGIVSFSLSNLRVLSVSDYVPTETGRRLRFQTMLDSSFNMLRLWRQGTVDVNLILYTPFTVALQVPVRAGKTINVMFNVLPLGQGEHKLFVDIYSNLSWPKPMLHFLLEVATSLTLLEDLPYLRRLTVRKPQTLIRPSQGDESGLDSGDTMQLYRSYVSLYAPTPGQLSEPGRQPSLLKQNSLQK
jgi:hypothetical protein